jgi:hypothetical protein
LESASPLLGYNNNVPYQGAVYHVQTEDSGSKRPHVITHLFADGGRIVKTKKTSYKRFVGSDNLTERVRTLMRMQHKEMVLSLRGGKVDHLIEPPEGADPKALAKDMVERAELAEDVITASSNPLDDRDFQREMEEIAGEEDIPTDAKGLEAYNRAKGARAEAAAGGVPKGAGTAPAPEQPTSQPSSQPKQEKETTYKYVGAKKPSRPPQRSRPPLPSTPPAARKGTGALPLTKKKRVQAAGTGDPSKFGGRFVTDRRFDEVVAAFFSR